MTYICQITTEDRCNKGQLAFLTLDKRVRAVALELNWTCELNVEVKRAQSLEFWIPMIHTLSSLL